MGGRGGGLAGAVGVVEGPGFISGGDVCSGSCTIVYSTGIKQGR